MGCKNIFQGVPDIVLGVEDTKSYVREKLDAV